MIGDIKPQLASAEDRLASILSTVAAKDFPDWWITAIRDARAELINMRDALEFAISDIMLAESADQTPTLGRDTVRKVRAALAPSPAGRVISHEEGARMILQKVLHTIWENPTTASWILELIEASGAIAAPQ